MLDERGTRILDAATELLLRWGYRKITVEDIAREAGVGKGTVYLHWKTKQQVFYGVFMREAMELARAILDRIREDVTFVLPGPMAAETFRQVMARPIAKAMFTGDMEVLGELVKAAPQPMQLTSAAGFYDSYLALMRENGFVRDDLTNADLFYLMDASTVGFYVLHDLPLRPESSVDDRARLMEDAVDRMIGPTRRPDRRRLPRLHGAAIETFQKMVDALEQALVDSQVS
ncbi:TetR/AcrR family transcriptional regulator [Fodinicola acaciae]|uniref:TetR/AcrR family transcriptional regulator n=1 Tax=Fodinicola acaciae TaxID=2681555 RepID=UPI0013D605F7|nr:TetR/AcrR family transcriptional regulator [Fodinicola acaciae]